MRAYLRVCAALWAAVLAMPGSWWQLLDIQKSAEQEFEFWASQEPMACPNDGEPLHRAPPSEAGAGAILYCPFDGWQYPRDYIRPDQL